MSQKTCYAVTLKVQNDIGVLARITVLLRKYAVNIRSLHVQPLEEDERFSILRMTIDDVRSDMNVVMAKLGRLVPVVSVEWEKCE